jgi:hypothetical protein
MESLIAGGESMTDTMMGMIGEGNGVDVTTTKKRIVERVGILHHEVLGMILMDETTIRKGRHNKSHHLGRWKHHNQLLVGGRTMLKIEWLPCVRCVNSLAVLVLLMLLPREGKHPVDLKQMAMILLMNFI